MKKMRFLSTPVILLRNRNYSVLLIVFLGCILLIYIGWIVFSFIHVSTYIWQSTTFANSVFPVERKTCNLVFREAILPSGKSIAAKLGEKSSNSFKIGILTMYDDADGTWNEHLMKRVIRNRYEYCQKFGYTLLNGNHLIDKSRPTAWSKLIAVKHYLDGGKFDYVVYMDMDIVIMNFTIPLESFISAATSSADIIMSKDWGGLNTGVWIAKRSNWTVNFLLKAWNQKQLVKKYSQTGIKHPFEYEQRAFHYLTNSEIWRQRGLPTYPGNTTEILSHFAVLPQCAFNSYSLHPFYWKGNREISQYIPGDFLIHFAGKKGQIKSNLIDYYLTIAEKSSTS